MTDSLSPIATIPFRIGGHTFAMAPRAGARFMASALSPPPGESNLEAVERVIETIAQLMVDPQQGAEFRAMWGSTDDPTSGLDQGALLEAWEEMAVHYTARPTDGRSPYSSGFGTPNDGSPSTPASPSPVAPDSVPSPPTSGGY